VQDQDYIRAGSPLSDGSITPSDILNIKGPKAVQEYLVNEIQDVYRLQGINISDKHIEVIVRQMMSKVIINDQGDSNLLEGEVVNRFDFLTSNDQVFGLKYVTDAGDSEILKRGQILTLRKIREENSKLKREDKASAEFRDTVPATATPILQGITRSSLSAYSWISAASFQETTKVLSSASIEAKSDKLIGLKENVIVGHKIPAGTGLPAFQNLIVGSKEELAKMKAMEVQPEESAEETQTENS
jgi:DNA-directed RNA polymerase subunit beta'